jgi:hypothetical protein
MIKGSQFNSSTMPEPKIGVNHAKFQKFDAFMPSMDNISILIAFQKLSLRTYSLAEAYSQSAISGLKEKSKN